SLVDRGAALEGWRTHLHSIPDLSRIAARVAGRRVRPVELAALRAGLEVAESLGRYLTEGESSVRLTKLAGELAPPAGLVPLLAAALPEPLAHRGFGRAVPARSRTRGRPMARGRAVGARRDDRPRADRARGVGHPDAQGRIQPGLRLLL